MSVSRNGYLSILALAASFILLAGAWLRPSDAPASPGPSEAELSRLMQLARRRAADDLSSLFSSVADRVEPSLLRVSATGLTGIVWSPGRVVTAAPSPYAPVASAPPAENPGPPASRGSADMTRPGDWVVGVWKSTGRPAFAAGHFVDVARPVATDGPAVREVRSTISLGEEMAGGGLFDLDARLLAVIVVHNGRTMALTSDSVDAILGWAETFEGRILDRFGLRVGLLTAEEAEHLRASSGLVVREVWDGSVADQTGLRPGDVITTLNDRAVTTPGDLGSLAEAEPASVAALTVHRRGVSRQLALAGADAGPENEAAPEPGPGLSWGARGYEVGAVAPGSRAAAAGIQPGDRLVRIDGVEPRTLEQVTRTLDGTSDTPAFLEFRRGARRWGILF